MITKIIKKFKNIPDDVYYATIIDRENRFVCINSYLVAPAFSKALNKQFPNTEINLFCGLWFSHENAKDLAKMVFTLVKNYIRYPKIKIHILCNTKKELNILQFLGVKSVFCNHNAFLDKNVFNIDPEAKKKYDCVYNGVLLPFKRHQLAAELDNVALITYNFKNVSYKAELDQILKGAIWLNYKKEANEPEYLTNDQIVEIYNQSRVGVALSAVEGAMYAAGEYLLCGIPVVSTSSKGGRDVFFTDYNSLICSDDAVEVKNTVAKMLQEKKDAERIREEMITMMQAHRDNFIAYVNNIYKAKKLNIDLKDTWDSWFVNKLRNENTIESYVQQLN